MATWWTYIPATITGAVGGLLAYGLVNKPPEERPCQDWQKLSEAVVGEAERLSQTPDDLDALQRMRDQHRELDGLRLTYPRLSYAVKTPSIDGADELWQATARLAVPDQQADAAGRLRDGVLDLAGECR